VQIHHGTADTSVPVEFSNELHEDLQKIGKTSELYIYEGDDHNIAANLGVALDRSVAFFDKYVKDESRE
jgi:dipeptidyl aminopeptidase/acylaminoacyl peptidase